MNSSCKAAVAAAVAGGYVLGRTRKAKAAIAIGTFIAGRRFGLTPAGLAAEGARQLRENPRLAELREQVSGEFLDAVRAAASTSADRRFSAFADSLRERGRDRPRYEEPEDEEPEEPEEEEPEPRAKKAAAKKATRAKKAAKKPPAKKAAAKRAAPARKKAAHRKKAASKDTASGRARSTANRRGR